MWPPPQTKPAVQGARSTPRRPPGRRPTPHRGCWSAAWSRRRGRSLKAPQPRAAAVCPPQSGGTRDSHQRMNGGARCINTNPNMSTCPEISSGAFSAPETAHEFWGALAPRRAETSADYCSPGLPGRRGPPFLLPGSICHWTKPFSPARKRVCLWRCRLLQNPKSPHGLESNWETKLLAGTAQPDPRSTIRSPPPGPRATPS